MLLHLYHAKCDSCAVKCYITSNPKLPNIAMLLELTVARSLNRFGLHWTSQVAMDYLQDSTCSFGRAREGFVSGLAKLAPMTYSRDVHGRAAEVHAFDSRGTMGF